MLIRHLVSGLNPDVAHRVEKQAAVASVVSSTATMLDVEVRGSVEPIPLPDGPLPITAAVVDGAGGHAGEVLIWIRAGRLMGLEQAWVTDDAPLRWPTVREIRLS
jgi:hypothetical protein